VRKRLSRRQPKHLRNKSNNPNKNIKLKLIKGSKERKTNVNNLDYAEVFRKKAKKIITKNTERK